MCLVGWDLPTDGMRVFREDREGQNTRRIPSLGHWEVNERGRDRKHSRHD